MNISAEHVHFWKLLEDFAGPIPNYIKNGFHFCGYNNAVTFKHVEDSDIDYVESVVKQNLYDSCAFTFGNEDKSSEQADKTHLFGQRFASQPQNFVFMRGDRILIAELSQHVKSIVDDGGTNHGLGYFKLPKIRQSRKRMRPSEPTSESKEKSLDDLKIELFEKAKKAFVKMSPETEFGPDIVAVDVTNHVITGEIMCFLCEGKGKRKRIRVHYQRSSSSSSEYWVISNINKHLNSVHRELTEVKQERSFDDMMEAEETIALSIQGDEKSVEEGKETFVVLDSVNDMPGFTDTTDQISFAESKMKDEIYSQISDQNVNMVDVCLRNEDSLDSVNFYLGDNVVRQIKVASIPMDGDCLFGALTHQLFATKLSARSHIRKTQKLREESVGYIKKNVAAFERELKNRLYDCGIQKNDYLKSDFISFLDNRLCKNGYWGGAESLKAISCLYEVNIIVFLEDGPCYVANNFNMNYKRSVCIAYRNNNGYSASLTSCDENKNIIFNHYDSVCTINQDDIIDCMEKIADVNKKQEDIVDRNNTIISLNDSECENE